LSRHVHYVLGCARDGANEKIALLIDRETICLDSLQNSHAGARRFSISKHQGLGAIHTRSRRKTASAAEVAWLEIKSCAMRLMSATITAAWINADFGLRRFVGAVNGVT
jgi:hypothetical protein